MAGRFYVQATSSQAELATYYGPFASASIMRKAMDQYMLEVVNWMEEEGLEPLEIEDLGEDGGLEISSTDGDTVVKLVPVLHNPLLSPDEFHW